MPRLISVFAKSIGYFVVLPNTYLLFFQNNYVHDSYKSALFLFFRVFEISIIPSIETKAIILKNGIS